ncbi:MAG: hypothetical protein V1695_03435 [Candidatus Uhrbacteria bacterium]
MFFLTLGIIMLAIGGFFSWDVYHAENKFNMLPCIGMIYVGLALIAMQVLFTKFNF